MEEQRREHLNWNISMTRLLKRAAADKAHARQRSMGIWTMWQRRQMDPELGHCLGPGLAVADPERVVSERGWVQHTLTITVTVPDEMVPVLTLRPLGEIIELVRSVQQNQTHFLPTSERPWTLCTEQTDPKAHRT